MATKTNKSSSTLDITEEPIFRVFGWILIVWTLYRYYFRGQPEWIDEFIVKPLVFVLPVFWYVLTREKRPLSSLGLTTKNFFPSLYIGLGFGVVFAIEGIVANYVKYGTLNIRPIEVISQYGLVSLVVLSLATSLWEEILNRGFLFNRLLERTKNLPYAAVLSTIFFMFLHVPILVTSLHFQGATLIMFFLTTFVLGLANALLLANTGSLVAPILVHIFWNMTVALYL